MNRIKALHQREKCYQQLQLQYDGSTTLKEEIYAVIEDVTLGTGMIPKLYENGIESIRIEFNDRYAHDGGDYFTSVLGRLGISHCEADTSESH